LVLVVLVETAQLQTVTLQYLAHLQQVTAVLVELMKVLQMLDKLAEQQMVLAVVVLIHHQQTHQVMAQAALVGVACSHLHILLVAVVEQVPMVLMVLAQTVAMAVLVLHLQLAVHL
jgi:hypothetical protein